MEFKPACKSEDMNKHLNYSSIWKVVNTALVVIRNAMY